MPEDLRSLDRKTLKSIEHLLAVYQEVLAIESPAALIEDDRR